MQKIRDPTLAVQCKRIRVRAPFTTKSEAACGPERLKLEIDRSIDLLEICLQQFGSDMKLWRKNDSDLEPIRSYPRYQKLLELAA
jgi:hypothetical protein